TPEKRRYNASGSIMTEAALDVTLWRDVYVSMGEPLADGAWGMRLQVKAFMRWVWLGAIFMAVGGLLAILDKRYRPARRRLAEAAARTVPYCLYRWVFLSRWACCSGLVWGWRIKPRCHRRWSASRSRSLF